MARVTGMTANGLNWADRLVDPNPLRYVPAVDAGTVQAVRLAFQRQRTGRRNWETRQTAGRIDPRNVWRNDATQMTDIFRDRRAPGATKVNVHLLVDSSGSMDWPDRPVTEADRAYWKNTPIGNKHWPRGIKRRIERATDISATLTEAFRSIPTVRVSVTLHTAQFHGDADITLYKVVESGRGAENIPSMVKMADGGNGDGYAIKHVVDLLRKESRSDEVSLLIVISDGLPSWLADRDPNTWYSLPLDQQALANDGTALVFNAVNEARERGVRVLSVAIADGINQSGMYGKDNVIPFDCESDDNPWGRLAVTFGAALGDTLAEAAKSKAKGRR